METGNLTAAEWVNYMNADPDQSHIKKNDDGSFYIPISITQKLLDEIFLGLWNFQVLRESYGRRWARGSGVMEAVHPITGQIIRRGGDAAIILEGNLRKDSPRLEAMILLSCARKFGRRLGRDLNRDKDDAPLPAVNATKVPADKEQERMEHLINDCVTINELETYRMMALPKYKTQFYKKLHQLAELTKNQNRSDVNNY